MKIEWKPETADISRVRDIVAEFADDFLVRDRWKRCISGEARPPRDRETLWHALLACLLTTQQRSGPESKVNQFLRLQPCPLGYGQLAGSSDPAALATSTLSGFGGIRRYTIVANQLAENHRYLQRGGWAEVEQALDSLPSPREAAPERLAARIVGENLAGLGPKQSRNFLQMLGLSRWEIPLDSRITRWLNGLNMPVPVKAGLLSDWDYYDLVSDAFQALCRAAEVPPAIVDAAIFASYDGGGWSESTLVW